MLVYWILERDCITKHLLKLISIISLNFSYLSEYQQIKQDSEM